MGGPSLIIDIPAEYEAVPRLQKPVQLNQFIVRAPRQSAWPRSPGADAPKFQRVATPEGRIYNNRNQIERLLAELKE